MSELYVDSIVKSYGHNQVLTDIYLSCKPGEVVGLLGRNGSGKTTLLKIIFGSLIGDRKFVKVDGSILVKPFVIQHNINYLPQDTFFPKHLRISKIIDFICNERDRLQLISNPLIKPLYSRKFGQLSGGERRLVEILVLMHGKGKYILLDEPFNGVEPTHQEHIINTIRDISATKGFIVTDHDYRNILKVATKVLLLHDGGIRIIKNNDDLKRFNYIPW